LLSNEQHYQGGELGDDKVKNRNMMATISNEWGKISIQSYEIMCIIERLSTILDHAVAFKVQSLLLLIHLFNFNFKIGKFEA
jgi:hypothetical protein